MRILFFLLLTFFLAQPSFSQQTTKKEMQAQMLEVVNDLKDQIADLEKQILTAKLEDPESVKDLEEQLVQLKKQLTLIEGVNKGISGISEKTFQQANEENNNNSIIPKRDDARINSIPKKILTDAELSLFVEKVKAEVEKKIPLAEKTKALELLNELKTKNKTPIVTGNVAAECWMVGASSMALYLMGKACMEDMTNTDNLNNYAAFLTMKGGEHAAIPILENLHLRFPGNSTILNNLGQAWYGLGEFTNANKYLDSTMHFYRNHPQANETKSEIQESEGRNQESIESLKRSIEAEYTPEKEVRLIKLGGNLNCDHLVWSENDKNIMFKYPKPAQPLGLEKYIIAIPEYPMSLADADINRDAWIDFKENVSAALGKQDQENIVLKDAVKSYEAKLLNPSYQATLMLPYNNSIYKTANRKLLCLIEWGNYLGVRIGSKYQAGLDTIQKWKDEYNKGGFRECAARNAAAVEFLTNANNLLHQLNVEMLTYQKEFISNEVSFLLYSSLDHVVYEWMLGEVKAKFLDMLGSLHYEWLPLCDNSTQQSQRTRGVLPDFDEANCQYKTELNMYFTKIKVECNKMTTTIEVSKFKGSLEENLATGKYNGKAEIEQAIGSEVEEGDIDLGPLKTEAKLAGRVGVEFNQDGIQDVYVEGEAELGVGPAKVSGATARYGFISGTGSITGSGALSGINIR